MYKIYYVHMESLFVVRMYLSNCYTLLVGCMKTKSVLKVV